jgi:ABC-type amino acid transport substrate-binding protein
VKLVTFLALWLVLSVGNAAAGARTLRVGVEGDAAAVTRRTAVFGGEACPAVDAFPLAGASRLDAELWILCNALREGGPPARLQLVSQPNYNRSLAEAIAGRLDLPSQTVWSSDLDQHADTLLRSLPVIRAGEWQVGLYTTENRTDVLAVGTVEQLRGLTAAAPRGWVEDWRALSAIGLKELIDVQNNDRVFHMIQAGRADFTLQAFSTEPDFGRRPSYSPVRVLPIRGFKVALPGSRHFAVARGAPDVEALVRQLDAGLARLRDRGAIAGVLERSGVFERRVADWRVVGGN